MSALRMYEDGLRDPAHAAGSARARMRDGSWIPLPLDRYAGPPDATDQAVISGLRGPVLDVGCGPGRHLRALAARGVLALGVDLSPVAVELAVGGGSRAIVGDIFDEVPGAGRWRSALLLDGNIGIGGSPERLLSRIAALLGDGGELLVEADAPGVVTGPTRARIELGDACSPWFPWARVAVSDLDAIAGPAGFAVRDAWQLADRWFVRLRRGHRARLRSVACTAAAASDGSVP